MSTLAAAFALAGLAVVFYALWLGRQQQQLHRRLEALESHAGEEDTRRLRSRAA